MKNQEKIDFKNYLINKVISILKDQKEYPDYFIGEGFRVCETIINSNLISCEYFFISTELREKQYSYIDVNKIILVSENTIKKMSNLKTAPGIIGLFKLKYNPYSINLKNKIDSCFILSEISDPGNLGTIIRTSVALNRKEIVLIGGCNPFSTKVIQASAGTISKIKIYKIEFEDFLKNRNEKIPIYGLDAKGRNLNDIPKNELKICYIVVGNEANGINKKIVEKCDRIISIPMSDNCESLNASIAASIVGYQSWSL